MSRDRYWCGPRPVINSNEDLVALINRLNREGVDQYRRLSPAVLISLMEVASGQSAAYFQALDPMAAAPIGVSWAGENTSANWFDTAREFTERWHHQQQIRLAANRPGIMTPELYYPVIDCFMRALPYAYRHQPGDRGGHVRFVVSGECGGSWFLYRDADRWRLLDSAHGAELARATIPQEIAWRVFTKGIDRAAAESQMTVSGNRALGQHILQTVAVVG